MKIATITLNPALDLTARLSALEPGEVNLVEQASLRAAGKGINVAMVLKDLGCDVTVTGWLGEGNQSAFVELFERKGLQDAFVRVHGETRINVKIAETSGRVTDLNLPGLTVDQKARESLLATLDKLCLDHDWFVLAGSLPKGVEPEFTRELIVRLKASGKKVIFDCSGAALRAGLEAGPTLVKPNREELGQWAGRAIETDADQADCAARLRGQGVELVVISDGSRGLLWFSKEGTLRAVPPRMQVVSTVGAGDSLVAGLVYGLAQGLTKEETVRLATAASALAVSQVAVGFAGREQLSPMMERVVVTQLMTQGDAP
ncbi:fructose-1-phosphate kinase [Aeromonas sp. RU39B]|uniref:1-phosphofructokinase n=1 Tax=Aeromonas sp. RU39B TaxID=1907416 RepID=UPI000956740A|nr:1-phosphofructokinase [Aeromonas sp. RU39B]SIR35412.1 fructose-1-phosphate kinase [Aeromonas sp. RU39B]